MHQTPEQVYFQLKSIDIFLISPKNIYCEYSLEVPWWDTSNDYPHHMFSWKNKKKISGAMVQSSRPRPDKFIQQKPIIL